MIRKILKRITNIYFYIGVNIIGLPDAHKHTIYSYKKLIDNKIKQKSIKFKN
jgi:hypothetical protein